MWFQWLDPGNHTKAPWTNIFLEIINVMQGILPNSWTNISPKPIIYSQELDILNSALQRRLEVFEQEKIREQVLNTFEFNCNSNMKHFRI